MVRFFRLSKRSAYRYTDIILGSFPHVQKELEWQVITLCYDSENIVKIAVCDLKIDCRIQPRHRSRPKKNLKLFLNLNILLSSILLKSFLNIQCNKITGKLHLCTEILISIFFFSMKTRKGSSNKLKLKKTCLRSLCKKFYLRCIVAVANNCDAPFNNCAHL